MGPILCDRVEYQSMYLTSPTFKVDLVIQSANFPKLSELSLGRHVTPRPCGVLLRRLICNLGERAFFFLKQSKERDSS